MKPAGTQTDKNLEFDGVGAGPSKGSNRFAGNKWGGVQNPNKTFNEGRGPTRGNDGKQYITSGASVTKDTFKRAPDSASGTAQKRNPGGTRAWDPKAGQNYSGNPDKIRIGQSGGPDYGGTSKGSKPDVAGGRSNFNYGPKSQY